MTWYQYIVPGIAGQVSWPDGKDDCPIPGRFRVFRIVIIAAGLFLSCQNMLVAGENDTGLRRLVEQVHVTGERQMLRGVCDQGQIKMHKGVGLCAVCPSYTTSAGEKGGFAITDLISGSFTAGNAREVLLNMEGCESDADLRGGMVLLRHSGSGWSRIHYNKAYRLRDCLKYPLAGGKYALLCNQSMSGKDGEIGEVLWVKVMADSLQAERVVRWYDNAASNPRRLVTVFPSHFQRSDFNHDGQNDLHILFRIREEVIPEKYAGAIDAIDAGYELDAPRLRGLVYLFDGKTFTIDEDSIETFDEINVLLGKYLPETMH